MKRIIVNLEYTHGVSILLQVVRSFCLLEKIVCVVIVCSAAQTIFFVASQPGKHLIPFVLVFLDHALHIVD